MNAHARAVEGELEHGAALTQSPPDPRNNNDGGPRARTGLPELLPVAAVATVLGVSIRTVRRLIQRGELVPYRIRRQVRVDAASVTHLLETSLIGVAERADSCR